MRPDEDPRNYDYPLGWGNAYIRFATEFEAKRARRAIHLMKYMEKVIEVEFYDRVKFMHSDFSTQEPTKREKMGFEFEGLENCAIEFTNA